MKILPITHYVQPVLRALPPYAMVGVNGAAIVGGIIRKERNPTLATGLLTVGWISHLWSLRHPIRLALMNGEQLASKAKMGHDMAALAIRMSEKTGFAPTTVSKAITGLWTISIPLIGIGVASDKFSHPMYCLTDAQAETKLDQDGETAPFTDRQRYQAKENGYYKWRQRGSPRLYQAATFLSRGQWTIRIAITWSQPLALLAAPALAPYAKNLERLAPLTTAFSVIGRGIRCYADFKADDKIVTPKAKWLSVADLVITASVKMGICPYPYGFRNPFIFAMTKACLIRHFRQREERKVFQASLTPTG